MRLSLPLLYSNAPDVLVFGGVIAGIICLGIGLALGTRGRRDLLRSLVPGWCIPFAYCAGAVLLGWALPRFEARLLPNLHSPMTVAAAMTIYSAVATGMITLTGIVFSLIFVMVQFSSTAYSPRLVLWMSRDPLLHHAIGVFTATFIYAIAALAWVDRMGSGKVPFVSVWTVVGLLLISVAVFVAMVHRLNRLHIHRVLNFTGDFGRHVIEALYQPMDGALPPVAADLRQLPVTQTVRYNGPPRTVQSLDRAALLSLAQKAGTVIEITSAVGDTLVECTPLFRLYGGETVRESSLRKAIHLGTERTFEQDPKYPLRLLVDIAIRALSAAVNDPSTAVQALDQIEDLMVRIGRSRIEIGQIYDRDGNPRVLYPVPTWEDFLDLAFEEIRLCGAESIQISRRMKALLSDLADVIPAERRDAVRVHEQRLDASIRRAFPYAEDHLLAVTEDREGLGVPRRCRAR